MKIVLGTVSKVLIYLNLLSFSCAMYGHSKDDRQPHAKQHVKSHLGSNYSKQLASHALTKSAQVIDARYSFDGNINEQQNDYDLALLGLQTQQYESRDDNQAIALSDRTWLELPEQLHREIQTDKSLSLSVDFFFKNTGVDESVRVILSNKDWAYDTPGLKITVFNEKVEWQPEGIIFAQFNFGMGSVEVADRFFNLEMNRWHTATVDLDFEKGEVAFGVNGRKTIRSLSEDEGGSSVDPSLFIASLQQKTFRVGVHQSPAGQEPEWRNEYDIANGNTTTSNLAEVLIDNLVIQSPRPAGDSALVKTSLVDLTNHIEGSASFTEQQVEQALSVLRENLNDTNPIDFLTELKAFVSAHAQQYGALYKIRNRNNTDNVTYDNLPAESRAYVDLGIWLLEQGITIDNAAQLQGVSFIEHTEFPGALPDSAERIAKGKADVRVEYVRDKGYLMGGMRQQPESELAAYLYRPTGFYAPAGEVVTVKVPEALVDSGVHIRVGAHADNHIVLTSTSRFPLISADFRVEAQETQVLNPFGGNIYVLVPQDTDLGWQEIEVENAVRAPFFSTRAGHETPAEQWSKIRSYPGVFTDLESDKFMITVPSAQLQTFDQPTQVLKIWDQIMDIMQVLHGRPLERSRAEAYLLDASQLVVGSFPGGYPVTPGLYAEGENGILDGFYTPFAALNDKNWEQDLGMFVMLHELGHHHYGRFILEGEQESYVNVPAVAVLNEVYGLSIDEALRYSAYQYFTLTETAIDWMVTHNFRNNNPIGFDPTTVEPLIETSYQNRGHAKYADLALISGGWDALGKIYQSYYLEDLASGTPPSTQVGVSHDDFLVRGSNALQCNLGSLFNFWGIKPSDEAFAQMSQYEPCEGALERVLHYLDNAPRTVEELEEFHTAKVAVHANQLNYQVWQPLLADFDLEIAQEIRDAGAVLLAKYFAMEKDNAPSVPQPQTTNVDLSNGTSDGLTFSWQSSTDDSNRELKYSWVLKRPNTDEVLLSKTWLSQTSATITSAEIDAALGTLISTNQDFELVQVVTTSDPFTVVASDPVTTSFTFQGSSDSGNTGGTDTSGNTDNGSNNNGNTGNSSGDSSTSNQNNTSSQSESSSGGGSLGGAFLFALMVFIYSRRKVIQ